MEQNRGAIATKGSRNEFCCPFVGKVTFFCAIGATEGWAHRKATFSGEKIHLYYYNKVIGQNAQNGAFFFCDNDT
ncbi:MAG: hypothetical protein IJW30_04030 [Clostridia bacterium]|nr:hypothetical protein [Clostridia bacterium]